MGLSYGICRGLGRGSRSNTGSISSQLERREMPLLLRLLLGEIGLHAPHNLQILEDIVHP